LQTPARFISFATYCYFPLIRDSIFQLLTRSDINTIQHNFGLVHFC